MPSKMVLDRHRREKSLRGLVKELRGKTVEGVTELVDVRGPTARAHHRDRLMSQVRRALESLRDPATEIPEPRKGE